MLIKFVKDFHNILISFFANLKIKNMKTKFLLSLVIFLFASIVAHAQIKEGQLLLGGSISYNNSNDDNSQNGLRDGKSFYTNIQLGKVINPNTVVGVTLLYGHSEYLPFSKYNQYGAGLFYRKYKPLGKNFYLFGEGDAFYHYSKELPGGFGPGSDDKNISNRGAISFTPGISYALCKKIQMELLMQDIFSIGYGTTKNESVISGTNTILTSRSHLFYANTNLNSSLLNNFGIGFKFFL